MEEDLSTIICGNLKCFQPFMFLDYVFEMGLLNQNGSKMHIYNTDGKLELRRVSQNQYLVLTVKYET